MNKCYIDFFTFGNLPTTYLSSLSFEEQIFKIFEEIKNIEDYLEDFSIDEINKTITELVNSKFIEIKSYIDNQDDKLYNYIDKEIAKNINDFSILLNQKVLLLMNYIESKNSSLKTELLKYLQDLYNYINNNFINNIKIIDPTNGKLNDIQKVANNLYNNLRYHGITALEFDTSGITCEQFDNKKLTSRNFDLYSKDYFVINFNHYMYSPFTGKIVPISEVVNTLADFHKTQITAEGFDTLELSAQDFDNKELTAYDFDFHGGTLLSA